MGALAVASGSHSCNQLQEIAMLVKENCNMIPLRLFMGLQMIIYGVVLWFTPDDLRNAYLFEEHGWMWIVLLVSGGVWLAAFAALEIYAGWNWRGLGKKSCRTCIKASSVAKVPGYFYCGAVWAGLGYQLLWDGQYQTVDFMAPTYLLFLLFIAYKDACKKRSRVLRHDSN